jgi:hypothetical protein
VFVRNEATATGRQLAQQLSTNVAAAVAADAKSTFAIARDAGIVHSDLLQFLGTQDPTFKGPYTQRRATLTLDEAAAISRGLTADLVVNLTLPKKA